MARPESNGTKDSSNAIGFETKLWLLDEVDGVLAGHYGFTGEHLGFTVNYEVKNRVRRDGGGEEGE
jgi:hypothetical protein